MRLLHAVALSLAVVLASAGPAAPGRETQQGLASFYGARFHGKKTSSGERFDAEALTAAHPTYPPGTILRVTNLENAKSAQVRVSDHGPVKRVRRKGVIIDLSRRTARTLGFMRDGLAPVRIEVLEMGGTRK